MIWKLKLPKNYHVWHPWFAWYPVDLWTDGDEGLSRVRVWLETIERRRVGYWSGYDWEYRLPFTVKLETDA
jgi:hypothetical protein